MKHGVYEPFAPGPFPVGERTLEAIDTARNCRFPCEVWYPVSSQPEMYPLILFSHASGGGRRSATFLTTHLASHGYVVAAMDHSEIANKGLTRQPDETLEQKAARQAALIANRVPDIRLLLNRMLEESWDSEIQIDSERIGITGHSFGGWTALAAPDVMTEIKAIVALAPGGNSNPRPGILRAKLAFNWGRDIPTLLLAAENDVSLPLDGMEEIFERTPATAKQMVILRRADHMHFMDNVEQIHESARNTVWAPELAWIQQEMRPIAELCSGDQAHLFVRGLTLCHMDRALRGNDGAKQFLEGDIARELASRGVDVLQHERVDELVLTRAGILSETASALIAALNAELSALYPEPGANHFRLDAEEVREGHGVFLIARRNGRPVGCGALRRISEGTGEVKRMYVVPEERGRRVGRAILDALESHAPALGIKRLVLETGTRQQAAIALYRNAGFVHIPPFGEYIASASTSVCMAKELGIGPV